MSNTNKTQSNLVAIQLFEEIAAVALDVRGLGMLPEERNIHVNSALIHSIVGMVNRIGWLADMGAMELGGLAALGADPAEWMLSPSFHAAKAIEHQTAKEVAHG
jgi:hypothetical protein